MVLDLTAEKGIMKYKRCMADSTFTAQSITTVVNSLFGAWNTACSDSLAISTSSTFVIPSKQVKMGDDFYAILDEFADSAGCVWDCVN